MRIKAVFAPTLSAVVLSAACLLSACNSGTEPVNTASDTSGDISATAAPSESGDSDALLDNAPLGEPTDMASDTATARSLDLAALSERKDPERLLRFYVSAIREKDWDHAAQAWSRDAGMTPAKLQTEFGGHAGARLAVGKGDLEGAAGSLFYEAPLVVDFTDGRQTKRGTIVLRRVNNVPGASEEQLTWRIERTSTLTTS